MRINHLGEEMTGRYQPQRVTMPAVNLAPLDTDAIEVEARQAQARVRTIRAGRDAWEAVTKAQSFEAWAYRIGPALAIGKAHALKVTRANAAWGRAYSREFNLWIKAHGFDRMPAATRSIAITLAENIEAIETWRATLPTSRQRRLVHPLSNVTAFRKAAQARSPDPYRAAALAWHRFTTLANALPADEARPLWQAASAEAAAVLGVSV